MALEKDGASMDSCLLKVSQLHFSYDSSHGREILSGVDLGLRRAEMVALLGSSGSGKSTLLSIIGLLNRASSGDVEFDGEDVAELNEVQRCTIRAKKIGFVFQHHFLLPELTALENVCLPSRLAASQNMISVDSTEQRARDLLDFLEMSPRMNAYPRQLSGGEQQRVSIARALIHTPLLLLADEPTGNLDSASEERVLKLLKELQRANDTTLLMVTHDPKVAASCERKLTMSDGRLTKRSP